MGSHANALEGLHRDSQIDLCSGDRSPLSKL